MTQHQLKPALILGSGFHRHVLREGSSGQAACLYDWHQLVTHTAQRLQIAIPSAHQPPVFRWESMIIDAAHDGYRDRRGHWRIALRLGQIPNALGLDEHPVPAAHRIERDAQAAVAQILREASFDYPRSRRSEIPTDPRWGCVISLNFDHAWQPGLQRKDLASKQWKPPLTNPPRTRPLRRMTVREERRLIASIAPKVMSAGRSRPRLWFPNGSLLQPETIRMGLRDYGAAPEAIRLAFEGLKAWERRQGLDKLSPALAFERTALALAKASEATSTADLSAFFDGDSVDKQDRFPLTWVAEFLYRPLVFAGIGLSDQESGLWWPLAQRQRNLARVDCPTNALTRILIKRDPERPACRLLVDAATRRRATLLRCLDCGLGGAYGQRAGRSLWPACCKPIKTEHP